MMRCILALIFGSLLAASALAQQATISRPGTITVPGYVANGGLPHWQACRAKVIARTGSCTVLFLGESTTAAQDALYNSTAADAHSAGIVKHVAGALNQLYGVSTQTNDVMGNHVVGSNTNANYLAYDTRVTALNNWEIYTGASPVAMGGYTFLNTDASAITFHPTDVVSYPAAPVIQTDTIDIWINSLSSGNLTVKVGGTTICTYSTVFSGPPPVKQTCSTTLGDNTYSIACSVAFACDLEGAVARNSTISQAVLINGAFNGATIAQWTATQSLANVKAFSPVLCVINELGNDIGANTLPSVYQSALLLLVQACQLTGDVLLTTGIVGIAINSNTNPIKAAVAAVAAQTNSPLWDSASIGGGSGWIPESNSNYGWNGAISGASADPDHQGAAGYAIYGLLLAQIMMN